MYPVLYWINTYTGPYHDMKYEVHLYGAEVNSPGNQK